MTARLLGCWPDRSPEWYAARAGRIGGSDIGTLMGWNPYQTRAQLLAAKADNAEPIPMNDAMHRGVYCEPAIAAWLADRHNITYDTNMRGTWVDRDRDWMLVNPDGVTTDRRLAEFKAPQFRDAEHGWGRAGTDQVPLCYAAQVMWGMGILGLREALIGVLAGQPKFGFATYTVKFDAAMFAYLTEHAAAFHHELTNDSLGAAA